MIFIFTHIYLVISKSFDTWHRCSTCVSEKGEEVHIVINQNCKKFSNVIDYYQPDLSTNRQCTTQKIEESLWNIRITSSI